MTEILKVLEFLDQDGMAEVEIRSSRIKTGLDPQGHTGLLRRAQLLGQLRLNQNLDRPTADNRQLFFNTDHNRPFLPVRSPGQKRN